MITPLLLLGLFDFTPEETATPGWRVERMEKTNRTWEAGAMAWAEKDPDDIADYAIDWTRWLDGDTISDSVFTVDGDPGVSLASESHTDTVATVWLAGGGEGRRAKIHNRITTAGGRRFDKTMTLDIKER